MTSEITQWGVLEAGNSLGRSTFQEVTWDRWFILAEEDLDKPFTPLHQELPHPPKGHDSHLQGLQVHDRPCNAETEIPANQSTYYKKK